MAADLSTTHFDLFGLPQAFDVDLDVLDDMGTHNVLRNGEFFGMGF